MRGVLVLLNFKNFIFNFFMLAIFIFMPFLMDLNLNFVGLTFFVNTIFCIIFIGLSLNKTINVLLFYYIFNLIFMSFVPWINYSNNIMYWSPNVFSDNDYLLANSIIFIFNVFIYIFYSIFSFRYKEEESLNNNKEPNFFISIILCLISFLIIFYAFDFNIIRLFFRGIEGDIYESVNANPLFSIFIMLSRLLPAFILIRYLVIKKYYKALLISIFVLLCAFPTGIARFLVAFIYLPLFLMIISSLRKSINLTLMIILSFIFIFPFLNQFRYFSVDQDIKFIPQLSFFNQAHFDAYQNLVEVLRVEFITYGYQLIGVLFFFIPRKIWNEKPTGSGHQLSLNNNYNFSNISMPYIAEGYVNFGYLGFILFCIFLAFLMKRIDTMYLNSSVISFNYSKGIFLCAAIFFMLRGDLMSSFSFLLAGIVSFKIAEKI